MSAHRKKLSVALAALVAAGALAGLAVQVAPRFSPPAAASAPPAALPAAEVDVAAVIHQPIVDWQNYSGRLGAVEQVDIRPLVSGTIVATHVKEGGLVKKGDALFTIDPRPYAAEVERAAAQLAAAETRARYAAAEKARAEQLVVGSTIARRAYDERLNAAREANANVLAARAALEAARIDLAHTRLTAPVAGRVSHAELTVGNIVAAGANAPRLATLVSISPIYATFDVDEQTYLRFLRKGPSEAVPVWLGLADEEGYSRQGAIASIDNHLDIGSGTIRVRARFDNADGALVPGLYARIKVGGGAPHPAILVHDAAIGTDQAKKYVLVVDQHSRARYREVRLGALHDGLRVVADGLSPGERIVVGGIQRVRPNDLVQANSVRMVDATRPTAPAH